jgi:hypothetical protein
MVVDHESGTYVLVRESSLYAWDDHAISNERRSTRLAEPVVGVFALRTGIG